jgi:FkbM family methyltransferase
MLISLDKLIEKYNIKFRGILHIGAHECEELKEYEKYISRNNILWVEALPEKVILNKRLYPNLLIEEAVVSDKIEKVTFHISNNGQSSSFLEFGLHTIHHPQIVFTDSFEVETKVLSDILKNYTIEFNFINIDIQGAELKALKGMSEYLHTIEYIYTEVNSNYVYKDCCLITELDEYLNSFGFERMETEWFENCGWGDALYIRKK